MAFSDLLDDEYIQENLDTGLVLQYSRNIAQRVRFLAFCFACLALAHTVITYSFYTQPSHSYPVSLIFFLIISATQGGSIYMAYRLFSYQKSILNTSNWVTIFDNKYKVWRALAVIFLFALVPISYLMLIRLIALNSTPAF